VTSIEELEVVVVPSDDDTPELSVAVPVLVTVEVSELCDVEDSKLEASDVEALEVEVTSIEELDVITVSPTDEDLEISVDVPVSVAVKLSELCDVKTDGVEDSKL